MRLEVDGMTKYPPIMVQCPHILHGGDYNPEQWIDTKEIWREDMRLARLAHCNTLSVGIFSWAALEPEEGKYSFAWMDEVMDMLAENGITAVLATPSGARPAWMSQKYPEVLRVEADRQRNLHGGRHNHCFTSPVYRQKVRQINTLLAERYRGHRALGLWHLSNEYSGECHCQLCQEAFRRWLKTRYTSLHDLNHAWWTAFWSHTYTDWSQIESPSPSGEHDVHGLVLDWKRFVTEQTVDFMAAEIEPLKRITPDIPVTTNMMEFFTGLNYTRLAEPLDVVSWDSYPVWRGDENDTATAMRASMGHDMFRSLKDGRPFMLMESSPSVTNWQAVAKLRRPGTVLLNSLQAVAHGSDTVQYFQFRKSRGSAEKFHGAVVDHAGTENTRVFREVEATGRLLSKLDAVVGTAKPAEVAIIYDVENRWAIEEARGFKRDCGYLQAVQDHYAPFWQAGITVDIIDSTKDLSHYRLVIAPMLYMLRPGVAQRIKAFLARGGTFVATYMTGLVDEHDLCFLGGFPGPLKDALGIWSEEIDCLHDGESREVSWNGKAYLARDYCEIVHLDGAGQLARFDEDFYAGSPAVTVCSSAGGSAYYVAARMDESFQSDFFNQLIEDLGIQKPFESPLPCGCTAQSRTDGDTEYIFLMNFLADGVKMDIGDGCVCIDSSEALSGRIELPGRSVRILKRRIQ